MYTRKRKILIISLHNITKIGKFYENIESFLFAFYNNANPFLGEAKIIETIHMADAIPYIDIQGRNDLLHSKMAKKTFKLYR